MNIVGSAARKTWAMNLQWLHGWLLCNPPVNLCINQRKSTPNFTSSRVRNEVTQHQIQDKFTAGMSVQPRCLVAQVLFRMTSDSKWISGKTLQPGVYSVVVAVG